MEVNKNGVHCKPKLEKSKSKSLKSNWLIEMFFEDQQRLDPGTCCIW